MFFSFCSFGLFRKRLKNKWVMIGTMCNQTLVSGVFKLPTLTNSLYFQVEYDIGTSSEEYLEVFSLDRMEQTAVPLTGIVWPEPKGLDPEDYRVSLPTILIANDEVRFTISSRIMS